MHLSDPYLSAPVGIAFWTISAIALGRVAHALKQVNDSSLTPVAGVMAAFVFSAQMVNFAIPGTGSSGHLSGAMLMSFLLGPHQAFLAMCSVLIVQCLFFADGGILALGCNIFNIGFVPAFVVYPLARSLTNSAGRPSAPVVVVGGMIGISLSSLMICLQIALSQRTELSLSTLLHFMVPIHLVIGFIEGTATWAILSFLLRSRPQLVPVVKSIRSPKQWFFTALVSLTIGSIGFWFASTRPDGLEWALERTGAKAERHSWQAAFERWAPFMDDHVPPLTSKPNESAKEIAPAIPIEGSLAILTLAVGVGSVLRRRSQSHRRSP